jgi:hypothetical protein
MSHVVCSYSAGAVPAGFEYDHVSRLIVPYSPEAMRGKIKAKDQLIVYTIDHRAEKKIRGPTFME